MAKRAPTAYFVFLEQNRESTRAEVVAAASGEKVSVAVVAKALGEKWRQLSEEEKAKYKALSAERAQALAAENAAAAEAKAAAATQGDRADADIGCDAAAGSQGDGGPCHDAATEGSAGPHVHPFGFPLSLIRRIMASDPEVNRIAGDAVKATAKATELMLELMAEKAYGAARKGKRRTLKFADVDHVACTDRRFVDMGLRDVFATESTFAEARGEVGNGKENAAEREGTAKQKKAAAAAAKNSRPITDFFKA